MDGLGDGNGDDRRGYPGFGGILIVGVTPNGFISRFLDVLGRWELEVPDKNPRSHIRRGWSLRWTDRHLYWLRSSPGRTFVGPSYPPRRARELVLPGLPSGWRAIL